MELPVIRTYVLRGLRDDVSIEEIDDAINRVQEIYIQPNALEEGKADYITRGEQTVTAEEPTTTDNLTYTAEYSPFQYGTVTAYVDGEEAEDYTIDYDNGTVTFEEETEEVTLDYTAHEIVAKTSIASDIYKINYIRDITDGLPGVDVPYFGPDDTMYSNTKSIQEHNDNFHFREIDSDTVLRFFYEKKLSEISEGGTTTPEIPAKWHDLYWMGALAEFDLNYQERFYEKLNMYVRERRNFKNTFAMKVQSNW